MWARRTGNTHALGRMYAVHPSKGDLFYLRLLLSRLIGTDVRTLCLSASPGQTGMHVLKGTHETFKDACLERGLIADDGEWRDALTEAAQTASSPQLRNLFLHIHSNCSPEKPNELFDAFWERMGDDLRLELLDAASSNTPVPGVPPMQVQMIDRWVDEKLKIVVLYTLRRQFDDSHEADRKLLEKLPPLSDEDREFCDGLATVADSPLPHVYNYNPTAESIFYESAYQQCSLVAAQKRLLDGIAAQAQAGTQTLLFVDAPGGCGKTFCFNAILNYYRSQGECALALATTGIAALQLCGGKTVHTGLKVPVDFSGTRRGKFALNITDNSQLGQLIKHHLKVLVWDEAAMAHRDIFDSVDYNFRRLRNKLDLPFGGVSVILGGDFRQCLPVVRNGTRAEQVSASILRSENFHKFAQFYLHDNIRVEQCIHTNPARAERLREWSAALLEVGNGTCSSCTDNDEDHTSSVPSLLAHKAIATLDDVNSMICDTFGDLTALSTLHPEELACRSQVHSAILCPLHVSVDYINARCLDMWTGTATSKVSVDEYTDVSDALIVTIEQINARSPAGSPPHRLDLKVGMPLILLRNMSAGLMNGTRMLLLEIRQNVLVCNVLNGRAAGRKVFIPRFVFTHEGPDQPLKWKRRQFPVKPCWAMTINKSQGQTLHAVSVCLVQMTADDYGGIVVDAAESFTHGQIYVGLSRCGDPDRVCIYTTSERLQGQTLWNVVFDEALQKYNRHDLATGADIWATNSSDLMYVDPDHPRGQFNPEEAFPDVPWHGYMFDDNFDANAAENGGYVHDDIGDSIMNLNATDTETLIEQFMNGEFDECNED